MPSATHMGSFLDSVPMSGIVRIRDMMFTVKNPFRLDQGDVSFDAPDTVKQAMIKAVTDNHTHYLPTTGLPRLRQLAAAEDARQEPRAGGDATTRSSSPTAAFTASSPPSTPCWSPATR